MFQLNKLSPLVKKRKRIGRGGSRGGTSGRGHKGQKARTGHSTVRMTFEGGQMPIVRRLPKRGFNNAAFQKPVEIINLEKLEALFDNGQEVTKALLIERGVIRGVPGALLKVLGKGSLSKKLVVHADSVSASAQEAIEKIGGKVQLTKEI